jgi:hypothetical protein
MKKNPMFKNALAIVQIKRHNKWSNIIWIYPDNVKCTVTLAKELGIVTGIRTIKPK